MYISTFYLSITKEITTRAWPDGVFCLYVETNAYNALVTEVGNKIIYFRVSAITIAVVTTASLREGDYGDSVNSSEISDLWTKRREYDKSSDLLQGP